MKKWLIIFLLLFPVISFAAVDTVRVAASTDDGYETGASINLTSSSFYMGRGVTYTYEDRYRFQINIEKGRQIDSVFPYFYSVSSQTAACSTRISFEDTADAATLTTSYSGNWNIRNWTTAYADWLNIASWNASTWYTVSTAIAINIGGSLSEVLNRSDWASGNHAVMKAVCISTTASGRRQVTSYDGSTTNCCYLVIYSTPSEISGQRFTPAALEYRACPVYSGKRVKP